MSLELSGAAVWWLQRADRQRAEGLSLAHADCHRGAQTVARQARRWRWREGRGDARPDGHSLQQTLHRSRPHTRQQQQRIARQHFCSGGGSCKAGPGVWYKELLVGELATRPLQRGTAPICSSPRVVCGVFWGAARHRASLVAVLWLLKSGCRGGRQVVVAHPLPCRTRPVSCIPPRVCHCCPRRHNDVGGAAALETLPPDQPAHRDTSTPASDRDS